MNIEQLTFALELRKLAVEMRGAARKEHERQNAGDFAIADMMDQWDSENSLSSFVDRAYEELVAISSQVKAIDDAQRSAATDEWIKGMAS